MDEPDAVPLQRIPLHSAHVRLGARMVPFGGWDMPVPYRGIVGHVTSGSSGPSGVGYVPAAASTVGTKIDVEVRGRPQKARLARPRSTRRR